MRNSTGKSLGPPPGLLLGRGHWQAKVICHLQGLPTALILNPWHPLVCSPSMMSFPSMMLAVARKAYHSVSPAAAAPAPELRAKSLSPQKSGHSHGPLRRNVCTCRPRLRSLRLAQLCGPSSLASGRLQADLLFLSLAVGLLFLQTPGDSAGCSLCGFVTISVWSQEEMHRASTLSAPSRPRLCHHFLSYPF